MRCGALSAGFDVTPDLPAIFACLLSNFAKQADDYHNAPASSQPDVRN
jgi:hypothetical protein